MHVHSMHRTRVLPTRWQGLTKSHLIYWMQRVDYVPLNASGNDWYAITAIPTIPLRSLLFTHLQTKQPSQNQKQRFWWFTGFPSSAGSWARCSLNSNKLVTRHPLNTPTSILSRKIDGGGGLGCSWLSTDEQLMRQLYFFRHLGHLADPCIGVNSGW